MIYCAEEVFCRNGPAGHKTQIYSRPHCSANLGLPLFPPSSSLGCANREQGARAFSWVTNHLLCPSKFSGSRFIPPRHPRGLRQRLSCVIMNQPRGELLQPSVGKSHFSTDMRQFLGPGLRGMAPPRGQRESVCEIHAT